VLHVVCCATFDCMVVGVVHKLHNAPMVWVGLRLEKLLYALYNGRK